MALVAEFTTARETFAVGRALSGMEGVTVELERIVPTEDSVVPYYWVRGDRRDRYEEKLASEPDVDDVEVIAQTDRGTLYRIEWHTEMSAVVNGLLDLDFTLLSGTCTADGWEIEVRFPSNDAAGAFQQHLAEQGVPHTLERVYQLADASREVNDRLTPRQHEALVVAYRTGYFDEPRKTDLSELADRLDISPSSASGRLRRGHAALIEEHLAATGQDQTARMERQPADCI